MPVFDRTLLVLLIAGAVSACDGNGLVVTEQAQVNTPDDLNFSELQTLNSEVRKVLAAAAAVPQASIGLEFSDAGFENGAGSWSNCENLTGSANIISDSYSGSSAMQVTESCLYQSILIAPDDLVELNCASSNPSGAEAKYGVSFANENWESIGGTRHWQAGSAAYAAQSAEMYAPEGAFYATLWVSSDGDVLIDDCSLNVLVPANSVEQEELAIGAAVAADNLLLDDSFRQPTQWFGCGGGGQLAVSNGVARLAGPNSCFYQTIDVTEGGEYNLRCDAGTNGNHYADLSLFALDGNYTNIIGDTKAISGANQTYNINLTAPVGSVHLAVTLYAEGDTTMESCTLQLATSFDGPTPAPAPTAAPAPTPAPDPAPAPAPAPTPDPAPAPDPAPDPAPAPAVSNYDLAGIRFLNQATFGATPAMLASLQNKSFDEWLDEQIALPVTGPESWTLVNADYIEWKQQGKRFAPKQLGPSNGQEFIVNHTWKLWIESRDQLRQRAVAALNSIFVISARVGTIGLRSNQVTAGAFLDMMEKNAFGNFRDILYDVSVHPAMGVYLSHIDNVKAQYDANGTEIRVPDENYAREIMQLFSIGLEELNIDGTRKLRNGRPIETYTQDDIFNLARVFTGWKADFSRGKFLARANPMRHVARLHAPEAKNFLGANIPPNTNGRTSLNIAIDTLFNHPNVGPFIGKQLIQRMVTSNPSPQYVARVARVFNNDGNGVRGNMAAVFKAILLDDEARRADAAIPDSTIEGKLREPVTRLTALARLLDFKSLAHYYPIANLTNASTGLAQAPFKSPSVFNFFRPGFTPPNSELANQNLVAPEFQIASGPATLGYVSFVEQVLYDSDTVFNKDFNAMLSIAGDSVALVDYLNAFLTAGTMTRQSIGEAVALVDSIVANNALERVKQAILMVSTSPAFLIQK